MFVGALILSACDSSGSVDLSSVPTDGASSDRAFARDATVDAATDLFADARPFDAAPSPTMDAQAGDAAPLATDAGADGGTGLPFTFTRPPSGTPLSPADLAAFTDRYLDLLTQTHFFDVVDERIHGWPESDPMKRYWYGTWWSGVYIQKTAGQVAYVHSPSGADNNGIRSQVLEGNCYANALWPSDRFRHLARRMIRGFNSWSMAMDRTSSETEKGLLARSANPISITSTDGGRTILFDYSQARPGTDSGPSVFVELPNNPYWGDIFIRNQRSKDDIGHMYRAIATLNDDCAPGLDADGLADLAAMSANYQLWARRVENDGWRIATWDKNLQIVFPSDTLAFFVTIDNAECDAMLSLHLFGHGDPGSLDCKNGIYPLEWVALSNKNNGEIIRSFHESATKMALWSGHPAVAQALLPGLVQRMEDGLSQAQGGTLPASLTEGGLIDLMLHAANTGVPLTWDEVRWLQQEIDKSYASYVTNNVQPGVYTVFDAKTPDGTYNFEPDGDPIHYRSLALPLGTCVAKYRNPTSMPLLDCDRVKKWSP